MSDPIIKNHRNQIDEQPEFKGRKRKRGQKNAQHHSHISEPSKSTPGGLQGHAEKHIGHKKAK